MIHPSIRLKNSPRKNCTTNFNVLIFNTILIYQYLVNPNNINQNLKFSKFLIMSIVISKRSKLLLKSREQILNFYIVLADPRPFNT